jgi:tRNA nucleotidyltransferase (CCA-adding enzyme)
VLLFELEVWELPDIVQRVGPPVDQDALNQERFVQKYGQDKPYIKDGRWVVETRRKYRTVGELMPELMARKKGFGKNIREMKEARMMEDSELLKIDDPGWFRFIHDYLD